MGLLDLFKQPTPGLDHKRTKIALDYERDLLEKLRHKNIDDPQKQIKRLREEMREIYRLSLIFLAYGRILSTNACFYELRRRSPRQWIMEHNKITRLLPTGYKRLPDLFKRLEPIIFDGERSGILVEMSSDAEEELKKRDLDADKIEALKKQIKISRSGGGPIYPDEGIDDLTTATDPHENYTKNCKKLCSEIKREPYITQEAARELAKYLMDSPIDAHNTLKTIRQILRDEIGIDEKNKIMEKETKNNLDILERQKLKKIEAFQYRDENINPQINMRIHIEAMLIHSYYFLLIENFDMFGKALKEVKEGSEKYGIKDKEWLAQLERYKNELADEKTSYVYEWMLPKILKVLAKEGKLEVIDRDKSTVFNPELDEEDLKSIEHSFYYDAERDMSEKALTQELDRAIGPDTPLHETKYRKYVAELQKEATRLYRTVNEKDAEKKGKLLAEYLLDFPQKAHEPVMQLHTLRAGGKVVDA